MAIGIVVCEKHHLKAQLIKIGAYRPKFRPTQKWCLLPLHPNPSLVCGEGIVATSAPSAAANVAQTETGQCAAPRRNACRLWRFCRRLGLRHFTLDPRQLCSCEANGTRLSPAGGGGFSAGPLNQVPIRQRGRHSSDPSRLLCM